MRDDTEAGIERPVKFGSLSAVRTLIVIVALGIIFMAFTSSFILALPQRDLRFRCWTGAIATCSGSKGRVMLRPAFWFSHFWL
jgi:hypothetical protein